MAAWEQAASRSWGVFSHGDPHFDLKKEGCKTHIPCISVFSVDNALSPDQRFIQSTHSPHHGAKHFYVLDIGKLNFKNETPVTAPSPFRPSNKIGRASTDAPQVPATEDCGNIGGNRFEDFNNSNGNKNLEYSSNTEIPGNQPQIRLDTPAYWVVYKPPFWQTLPLGEASPFSVVNFLKELYSAEKYSILSSRHYNFGSLYFLSENSSGLLVFCKTRSHLKQMRKHLQNEDLKLTLECLIVAKGDINPILHGKTEFGQKSICGNVVSSRIFRQCPDTQNSRNTKICHVVVEIKSSPIFLEPLLRQNDLGLVYFEEHKGLGIDFRCACHLSSIRPAQMSALNFTPHIAPGHTASCNLPDIAVRLPHDLMEFIKTMGKWRAEPFREDRHVFIEGIKKLHRLAALFGGGLFAVSAGKLLYDFCQQNGGNQYCLRLARGSVMNTIPATIKFTWDGVITSHVRPALLMAVVSAVSIGQALTNRPGGVWSCNYYIQRGLNN